MKAVPPEMHHHAARRGEHENIRSADCPLCRGGL